MIEAKLPDGTTLQFPDGTAGDVIDRVVRQHLGVEAPQPERDFMHALGDNLIGYDDGVQSFGEDVGQWLNRGVESATLGLAGDEANAFIDSKFGRIGDGSDAVPTYDEALARRRGDEARYQQDHPYLAFGADVAGALAPGLGLFGAAGKGANLATRMMAGGAVGGIGGGITGFMEGEGGAAARINNAIPSAGFGAGFGAAVPVLGDLAKAGWQRFGGGAQAALRGAQDALGLERAGTELAADAVARDAPFAAERLAEAGPNAINAEMGPNSASLLDFVVNRPGGPSSRAYAAVEDLADTRGGAFRSTLDDVLGDPMGVTSRTQDLMDTTRAARQAAYAGPYAHGIDYLDPSVGPRFNELLDRVPAGTLGDIQDTMQMGGYRLPTQPIWTGADDLPQRLAPDVEGWDYIARSLADRASSGAILGADAPKRIEMGNLSGDIRDALDEIVPGFRDARALGRDTIANRNAIDFGSRLLDGERMPMDVAESTIARMGDAERAFARQGLRDRIAETMANVRRLRRQGGDNEAIQQAAKPVLDLLTEAGQRKAIALLGEEEAGRLLQSAREAYSALVLRNSVARNSATAPRQAWEEILDRYVPAGPLEAVQSGGGTAGAVGAVARPILGDPAAARVGRREQVLEAIANVLLDRAGGNGPGSTLPVLQQLPGLLAASNQGAARIGTGAEGLAAIVGALLTQQYAR